MYFYVPRPRDAVGRSSVIHVTFHWDELPVAIFGGGDGMPLDVP